MKDTISLVRIRLKLLRFVMNDLELGPRLWVSSRIDDEEQRSFANSFCAEIEASREDRMLHGKRVVTAARLQSRCIFPSGAISLLSHGNVDWKAWISDNSQWS